MTAVRAHTLYGEGAARVVFASSPRPEVAQLRPRVIDAQRFAAETAAWNDFHDSSGN